MLDGIGVPKLFGGGTISCCSDKSNAAASISSVFTTVVACFTSPEMIASTAEGRVMFLLVVRRPKLFDLLLRFVNDALLFNISLVVGVVIVAVVVKSIVDDAGTVVIGAASTPPVEQVQTSSSFLIPMVIGFCLCVGKQRCKENEMKGEGMG